MTHRVRQYDATEKPLRTTRHITPVPTRRPFVQKTAVDLPPTSFPVLSFAAPDPDAALPHRAAPGCRLRVPTP
jgi:hypothetical protein